MIFDEIVLSDFGLYAGRQSITLTPPSADKPVILIGGLNGGGKTTLLDALQLCLYGPHARISNRGSLAYSEFLTRSIHRGVETPQSEIELKFRHTVEGKPETYHLRRSWSTASGECREDFEVIRNGVSEPVLAENWITHVEDLMPPNIAHLFLFDGEQIESYASLANSSALIGAAIQNLLGLDLVEQLGKDLHVFEKRKRTEDKDDISRSDIETAENELQELRARSTQLTQAKANLRSHTIDRISKKLVTLETQFRRLGGELYDQRAVIEKQREEQDGLVESAALALRELAAGALPLCLVAQQLKSISDQAEAEQVIDQNRALAATLKTRDEAIIKRLRSEKIKDETLEGMRRFLAEDREKRLAGKPSSKALDLSPSTRNEIAALLHIELASAGAGAKAGSKEYRNSRARAEKVRTQFDSIPDGDTIAGIIAERDGARKELAQAESEYAAMSADAERVFREIERKAQALARLLEEGAKAEGERQDRARILRHSAKVRETIIEFRRTVTARHIQRIEKLVLDSYRQLLRKTSLITGLTIDAETYALTMYGRDNKLLSPERLSAGERQLLATALLWGLAKASGRPLPTAIDTPLGRLDGEHRAHLVERYFPYASHQVLLLSTDEEITGDYLKRLEPWIGRKYCLDYSDQEGRTQVVPGYIQSRVAA